MPETTCLGAAIAAGLAVGYYTSIQDVESNIDNKYMVFHPKMTAEE